MSASTDPSAALASLLAILSQTTKGSVTNGHPSSQTRFPHVSAPLEPVFVEGDILDTSQWIGSSTVLWYEPRNWQLPRIPREPRPKLPPPSSVPRLASPSSKRQRSESPHQDCPSPPVQPLSFPTYSQALKHVVLLSQSESFIMALKDMRTSQHNLESDLFEERQRIIRKYESKRKMDTLLQSLGSQNVGEEV
jgi:hypothetical protein